MALLEDPTIQRILDEVNKAASDGVLGAAGNYISDSVGTMGPFESQLSLSAATDAYHQQNESALFYPTPDMLRINDLMNFDPNTDFNSISSTIPIATPSNFDLYGTHLYDSIPTNLPSAYDHYQDMNKCNSKQALVTKDSKRSTPSTSSVHNERVGENQHQAEYSSTSNTVPNLGLNVRTPSSTPLSSNVNVNKESSTPEPVLTDTEQATLQSMAERDQHGFLPSVASETIDSSIDLEHLNAAGQIYYDPNPQIIQRKGPRSVTYQQNITVRFLQPPPIANAGPLVIKEVRAPPPPPMPPLIIKQRPTPPKTPPPIIIRERPPPLPSSFAPKVITRQLPPEPAPPRSVIIERLPPLPPKPRDIIIERWLPYRILNPKRKVIVERAQKTSTDHPQPKNIIITYEPVQAKIVRHFQKQNVTREDPQAYAHRYNSQLYDPNMVIQQAQAVGVYEDLNPPGQSSATTSKANDISDASDESDKAGDNYEIKQIYAEQNQPETTTPLSTFSLPMDEAVQDEDVYVEENITPFYINSGEDWQQTLHRLGLTLSETSMQNQSFCN